VFSSHVSTVEDVQVIDVIDTVELIDEDGEGVGVGGGE